MEYLESIDQWGFTAAQPSLSWREGDRKQYLWLKGNQVHAVQCNWYFSTLERNEGKEKEHKELNLDKCYKDELENILSERNFYQGSQLSDSVHVTCLEQTDSLKQKED